MRKAVLRGGKACALALAAMLPVAMVGCGSDSGGLGPVTYSGKTTAPAVTDQVSAEALVTDFMGSTTGIGAALSFKVGQAQPNPGILQLTLDTARDLQRAVAASGTSAKPASAQKIVPVSDTQPCLVSGSRSISGTADDVTLDITGKVSFNACSDVAGEVLSGSASATMTGYDTTTGEYTDMLIDISHIRMTSPGVDLSLTASIHFVWTLDINPAGDDQQVMTGNIALRDNLTGEVFAMMGAPTGGDFTHTSVYDDISFPTTRTEDYSAAFCIASIGCVTVSTTTPVVFASDTDQFPSSGGPIVIGGTLNNVSVQLTPVDVTNVTVDIDLDADTVYSGVAPDVRYTTTWASL